MIRIENLNKSFGKLAVLKGINTTFEPGEITAVIGHNGSGKTTLIKCILGLVKMDSGLMFVDDFKLNGDWSYRNHIGYMPQISKFPENLTASEIFEMMKDLRGKNKAQDKELISYFKLQKELLKPLRTLSGGNRQKISAVIALMFDADILILDEPTAGLDPVSSSLLKDLILLERQKGKTVIITSHIMSELEELANNVVCLFDGEIFYSGTVADLIETSGKHNLERAIAKLMTGNDHD